MTTGSFLSSSSWIVSSVMEPPCSTQSIAEFCHPRDAGVVGGVGGDGQAVAVGLVNEGVQLVVGEFQRVVARHNLDQIGPLPLT